MDLDSICHFMNAFQWVFVLIRSKPEGLYYIDLLKLFERYTDLELTAKRIAELKNDIDAIENIDPIEKEDLKNAFNINQKPQNISDTNKLKKYIFVLPAATKEMIKLLEKNEYERVLDIADAVHNLPEFLLNDLWRADKYYRYHIKLYNNKWNDHFLEELERKNNIISYIFNLLHKN